LLDQPSAGLQGVVARRDELEDTVALARSASLMCCGE
jgi:hypothetical protein